VRTRKEEYLPDKSGHWNLTEGGVQAAKTKGPKETNRYLNEFNIRAVEPSDHPELVAEDVAEDHTAPDSGRQVIRLSRSTCSAYLCCYSF